MTDDLPMLLRLDNGEPPLDAAEAEARRPYERIVEALAVQDEAEPDEGWIERVVAARRAEGRDDLSADGRRGYVGEDDYLDTIGGE